MSELKQIKQTLCNWVGNWFVYVIKCDKSSDYYVCKRKELDGKTVVPVGNCPLSVFVTTTTICDYTTVKISFCFHSKCYKIGVLIDCKEDVLIPYIILI